ncbi:hypothetical protein BTZ20_5070 [Rhodococcus sp. MTM3W5.2]|nr:hypothetical protein BTZ20_5070 [Rhodococcus sp. MTM3W5.2]
MRQRLTWIAKLKRSPPNRAKSLRNWVSAGNMVSLSRNGSHLVMRPERYTDLG